MAKAPLVKSKSYFMEILRSSKHPDFWFLSPIAGTDLGDDPIYPVQSGVSKPQDEHRWMKRSPPTRLPTEPQNQPQLLKAKHKQRPRREHAS